MTRVQLRNMKWIASSGLLCKPLLATAESKAFLAFLRKRVGK